MPIRISANYLSQILVNDLNRSLGSMLELQRQAGSMLRIGDYADDPRGVGAMQRYNTLIANNDQYLRNLNRSKVLVDGTDSALQDISDVLASVRELVLRESSALGTTESRTTSVIEVGNLTDRMLDVLNTTVEGNYLFAGTRTDAVPFVRNGDTVVYQGNGEMVTAQVGPNATQTLNIPGDAFMGALSATLSGGQNLTPRLDAATALDDLNLGNGWTPGPIEITDGTGGSWTVDLTGSATIGDAMAAIAADTGGAVTLAISPDGSGLQLSGAGPLAVDEVDGGQTATTLGIRGASDAGSLIGRDVRTAIDPATALADIPALGASLPLGILEVETAGGVTAIDLSGATTLGDLKTTVEAALPGFELRLDTGGLSLISGSTEAFHVRNAGAPDTATLLGLEGTGSPVRLFGVMEELVAALQTDDTDAIQATLVELEQLEQMVQSQMIATGGRQQDIAWTESLLMRRDTELRSKLSLEKDADVAEVSAALAQAEMSYQSSLLVTSKLFKSNLMMYL